MESKKIILYSTNKDWGGSELLWFKSVPYFKKHEILVHVLCDAKLINKDRKSFLKQYCNLNFRLRFPKLFKYIIRFLCRVLRISIETDRRINFIKHFKPDFVLVNQGLNFDAFDLLEWLAVSNFRYGVISHAVNDSKPFNDVIKKALNIGFARATFNGFVSRSNAVATSMMIGAEIPKVRILRNPVSVTRINQPNSSPLSIIDFTLAFVGRIEFSIKGQNLLLQALESDKWQSRNLIIRFYGVGPDVDKLQDLLSGFPDNKHKYLGFIKADEIWEENMGLILTSHYEGLPIVIVEAGLSGRISIVTNVSGNAELIRDNVDGFVAASTKLEDIDEALERAWSRRHEWESMGKLAREHMNSVIPENPEKEFAESVMALIDA